MMEGGYGRGEQRWSHSTRPSRTSPGSGTTGWAVRTTLRSTASLPRRCWRSTRPPRRWPGRTGGSSGLPTAVNTHDIAREVAQETRVAYVDNDPIVISHARSLLAKSPGVIAVPGDMRDPGRILADDRLAGLIDLAQPACVILSGVLHFADAGTARDVAAAFVKALAPNSYLIISVGSGNPSEGENFTSAYTAARVYIHTQEEVQGFFGGLELVPPGVVSVRGWYGGRAAPRLKPRTATFLGGVARKP